MLYRDIIQFEALEDIIQLQLADDKREATQLVNTYVVSDRMADLLVRLVIPNLQIDRPTDQKGILIVGNYGTGKSHLMAVLSAVSEYSDLASMIRNEAVRSTSAEIAGRFKVLRMELGGVEKSLRNIILDELEAFLRELGCDVTFPPATAVTNNKQPLIDAMTCFRERYPDQGLLLVVDELLDYLRTRQDRALILDLGFLRELGEVVELTPLRFIAGVQETLFDNPRFSFVADQLRRVRDRFEQVRIAREDIAFVVSERLLRKDDAQVARVTEHLQQFTTLYPQLAERLVEFARLYPIHPTYIDTFEQVYIAEKREVMKTFSLAIRDLLDREVPREQPGLISYDQYWKVLVNNPSLRSLPGVANVVDASEVLSGKVESAYGRRQLLPAARRIIDALSVHRLTTADIRAPIGLTVAELRDGLFLWAPMPESDPEFLADTIQTALNEIRRTVSGQFISYSEENGQYYIDPNKTVDLDAQISEKGDFFSRTDLNRYFYDALQRLLNLPSSVYVTGYSIWFYELPWTDHHVTRPGYLFFGAPEDRSTAQPPRDFYVYILPPFAEDHSNTTPSTSGEPDEVMFALQGVGNDFERLVRSYAGARSLGETASDHRESYQDKAEVYLGKLTTWLRQNLATTLRVTYRGVTQTASQALAGTRSSASRDPEELLRVIAAQLLAPQFGDAYPDYPRFDRLSQALTEAARPQAATDAIRFIATRYRTNLAIAVLSGLGLLDEQENVKPLDSLYARRLLDKLLAKPDPNQVVNQGEVITLVAGEPGRAIYKEPHLKLEPEWVAVALLALVYDGQITLTLAANQTLDAGNIEAAATRNIADLADFRHYGRTRDIPLPVWTKLFEEMGLQAGLLREDRTRDQAIRELQAKVLAEQVLVAQWQSQVTGGIRLWNESLFTDTLRFETRDGDVESHSELPAVSLSQADLLPSLRATKELLEKLARFNAPGRLRNLTMTLAEATVATGYRRAAMRIPTLLDRVNRFQPIAGYLSEAMANLPAEHPWVQQARTARRELLDAIRVLARREGALDSLAWEQRLEALKREYINIYSAAHAEHVLGPSADDRRVRLMQDPRVQQVQTLAGVEILHRSEYDAWSRNLAEIPTCREFHAGLLNDTPTCPRCGFRPVTTAGQPTAQARLDAFDARLSAILEGWHAALRSNLQSEAAQHSVQAMTPQERAPLDAYLALADPAAASLPRGLATSANQALHGIETVPLAVDALAEALRAGGLPCTVEQLTERFNAYVTRAMTGHDRRNTRLTLQ